MDDLVYTGSRKEMECMMEIRADAEASAFFVFWLSGRMVLTNVALCIRMKKLWKFMNKCVMMFWAYNCRNFS